MPLQRPRCCLKDSLFNMTVFVLATDDEANILAFFYRIVTLKDETLVLCFDELEATRNTREHGAYAASDNLREGFDEREFFLVERRVFGYGEDDVRRVPFLQLDCNVVDEEFIAGKGQAVLGIEVCEVRELVGKLVAQPW